MWAKVLLAFHLFKKSKYAGKISKGAKALGKDASLKTMGKGMGEIFEKQLKKNPKIRKILTAKKNSVEYKKAFKNLADKKLPSQRLFRTLMDHLEIPDPSQLIKQLKEKPEAVMNRMKTLPKKKLEDIEDAASSDINEAALSSSWLGYGTFIPSRVNSNKGVINLTTKYGKQFKTPLVNKLLWDKMKKQMGVTIYKKGQRSGASYGAGTILHKYVPQRQWKKGN